MLTQGMIDLITTYTIGCVATVREDGTPAVSPKATFLVLDEQTVAFANLRSPGTVANLRHRADVEVDFIDVFARRGCRIRGIARYVAREDSEPALRTKFGEKWPDLYNLMKGFVLIDLIEAEVLASPSYDIGADATQLTEYWLRHYAAELGFSITKQADSGLGNSEA